MKLAVLFGKTEACTFYSAAKACSMFMAKIFWYLLHFIMQENLSLVTLYVPASQVKFIVH